VSLAGRIVAVADLYDALTQARAYKPAFSEAHAVQMLRSMVEAGKLDGDCVEALLRNDEARQAIQMGHTAAEPQDLESLALAPIAVAQPD
jgi:HD-GYP domain-containing protein (c-di-GMP phosphodiesterase class II)